MKSGSIPTGREVKGDELKLLATEPESSRRRRPSPRTSHWQLKFRGYEQDEILTRTLKTDTNGAAQLTFTPEREGYYRVAWTARTMPNTNRRGHAPPITAETTVWVATGAPRNWAIVTAAWKSSWTRTRSASAKKRRSC